MTGEKHDVTWGHLVSLVYSIRGYLALANAAPYVEEPLDNAGTIAAAEAEALVSAEELPLESMDSEKTVVVSNIEELISQSTEEAQLALPVQAGAAELAEVPAPSETAAQEPVEQPGAGPEPAPAARDKSKAEEFVKGIYEHISHIDSRLDSIESSVGKKNLTGEFALRFLEDMMTDFESLNREKIKARIEFLISDLKK